MDPQHKKLLIVAAVSVFGLWIATPVIVGALYTGVERGTFGDLFGSVNALFSGLALLGVIAAIMLQQKELNLSTKELRNSARALRKQVELSADAARIQALPGLIESQIMRIKSVGGKEFQFFDEKHVAVQWVREKISTLPSEVARLERQIVKLDPKGTLQADQSSIELRPIDILVRELNSKRAIAPELELLATYMEDLSSLYKRISETKLAEDESA